MTYKEAWIMLDLFCRMHLNAGSAWRPCESYTIQPRFDPLWDAWLQCGAQNNQGIDPSVSTLEIDRALLAPFQVLRVLRTQEGYGTAKPFLASFSTPYLDALFVRLRQPNGMSETVLQQAREEWLDDLIRLGTVHGGMEEGRARFADALHILLHPDIFRFSSGQDVFCRCFPFTGPVRDPYAVHQESKEDTHGCRRMIWLHAHIQLLCGPFPRLADCWTAACTEDVRCFP